VLLPQSSESKTEACSAFLKEASSRCVLCSTVKAEAIELIDRAYDLIAVDFRRNLKPYLEEKGKKELTNRDGKMLANFFSERRRTFKITQPQRSNVRNEIIGVIENFVASQLHSLKDGFTIKLDDFLAFLMLKLADIEHKLKAPFMGIRPEDITPDDAITSLIVLKALIANPNDIKHLGSALKYQYGKNKWVIFVTTDESEILSKESDMFEIFALQCSKPEWALDNYREMTKLKSPIEHFREKKVHSNEQREFAGVLEKVMSIKIIS
jgi:ribosomal protein S17E